VLAAALLEASRFGCDAGVMKAAEARLAVL
jgi:hypothetical protein